MKPKNIPALDIPRTPSSRQVKAIRAWLGQSQPDFAANCSISLSALVDYEKGRRKSAPDTLAAIAMFVATLKTIKFNGSAVVLAQ